VFNIAGRYHMLNFKIKLILLAALIVASSSAIGGTLLLMHVGPATMGAAPTCSNALDFSQACNSQYIGAF
jgi:hypothetical protein